MTKKLGKLYVCYNLLSFDVSSTINPSFHPYLLNIKSETALANIDSLILSTILA